MVKRHRQLTPEQKERYYELVRDYIARRKSDGLCVRCGKPNDNSGRTHCKLCSEIRSLNSQGVRDIRRMSHECTMCGAKIAESDKHKSCAACRQRVRDYYWRRKYGMTKEEMLASANTRS